MRPCSIRTPETGEELLLLLDSPTIELIPLAIQGRPAYFGAAASDGIAGLEVPVVPHVLAVFSK